MNLPAHWTPSKIIQLFQRGVITSDEMLMDLLPVITNDNVADSIKPATCKTLELIKEHLQTCPTTDIEWLEFVFINAWVWYAAITEEKQQAIRERMQAHRRGVEALRTYFAAAESGAKL